MRNCEEAHQIWLKKHLTKRKGERRSRLERGHQHAESMFAKQIWWMLKGSFDQLHPEYEVVDWRGRSFFVDFVWICGFVKIVFEIKGYAAHVTNMDRVKYCNELNRETFLTAMGYTVISISYDDVEQRPELVIQLIKMVLSRFTTTTVPERIAAFEERGLIRLAVTLARPLRPADVAAHFGVTNKTARRMVKAACSQGWFVPLYSKSGRAMSYALVQEATDRLT